jgi:hypothetical protein
MIEQTRFKTPDSITGATAVTTSEQHFNINGKDVTLHVLANSVWINTQGTAVADATSFKLTAGMTLELHVVKRLSVISDETGGTLQMIVWKY